MLQSKLVMPTLREGSSDAEAVSHGLMLRAGLIRQLASGIYTYLPLGRRVLRKVEQIVREEMDRSGGQEVLMPAMQPAELWKQSGRYEQYGPELIRLQDRSSREFALGPTHEEVVTALANAEINSYRQLPVNLYQIQTKFRDELRPRYGLLRGREFLMKDAYSFDADWEGLDRSYWQMYEAYNRIFTRCGLKYRAVEADAGTIGGEGGTHEFMALAQIGEDTIAACDHCDYAANLEKAEYRFNQSDKPNKNVDETKDQPELLHTPNIKRINELTEALQVEANQIIKTLIYLADGNPVAVLLRGDHSANEIKVKNALGAAVLELADAETTERVTGAATGFAGPVGLTIPIIIDYAVAAMDRAVTGANRTDYHFTNVSPDIHFSISRQADLRNAASGDGCPRCEAGRLTFHRGIEVGHVFKLGTKYSESLGATFTAASGEEKPFIMGCYGIGVSRLLSAIVEQYNDSRGICWPLSIAPYQAHIVPISAKDSIQMDLAKEIADRLSTEGVEVLIDDRDERPGVKFNDSDLIGIPYRIVIGKHASERKVEVKERAEQQAELASIDDAIKKIVTAYRRLF